MTEAQEKQLLQAIYDRLFDAITYQPSGGKNPFTAAETFIHFSKNAALDPSSFRNPRTPANPLGDLKASEAFAREVDKISPMTLEWDPGNDPLSRTYTSIVRGANTLSDVDPKAKEMYDKAYNYLHPEKEDKNPFTGETTKMRTDGPDYVTYQTNMDDYVAAVIAYRAAYNRYLDDLSSSDAAVKASADRKWQEKEPLMGMQIRKAQNALTAGNARYVEQALQILNTTTNDGIREALSAARDAVLDDKRFSSSLGFPDPWLFSYPSPANWAEPNALNFTELKISGGETATRSQSTEHHFAVDSSVNVGLWRVKASASGKYEHSHSSTDVNSVEISAEIAKVSINRPWFTESLFRLDHWHTNQAQKGGISNGMIDSSNKDNLMPMYPVAFIVARNIVIKADFSHEDQDHIKESLETSASVGWGPFSIGGNYGYGKQDDKFNSDFQNGEIRIPGMQIIGWVSRVIPNSPRMNAPQMDAQPQPKAQAEETGAEA